MLYFSISFPENRNNQNPARKMQFTIAKISLISEDYIKKRQFVKLNSHKNVVPHRVFTDILGCNVSLHFLCRYCFSVKIQVCGATLCEGRSVSMAERSDISFGVPDKERTDKNVHCESKRISFFVHYWLGVSIFRTELISTALHLTK